MSLDISIQDYRNIIVSFWKMGLDNKYKLICVGALVSLDLVVITLKSLDKMPVFSEIIVSIEGYNNSRDKIWPTIERVEVIRTQSRLIFLVVSSST